MVVLKYNEHQLQFQIDTNRDAVAIVHKYCKHVLTCPMIWQIMTRAANQVVTINTYTKQTNKCFGRTYLCLFTAYRSWSALLAEAGRHQNLNLLVGRKPCRVKKKKTAARRTKSSQL